MDYQAIVPSVKLTANRAAHFIKSHFGKVEAGDIEIKALNSLVSYVDTEAEKIIVNGLKEIIPEAGFLTEEDTIENTDALVKWIIDPLDGTTNFLHSLPIFAVSIALEINDEIVLGLVVEVISGDCYSASKGGGAFLNDDPIRVSQSKSLKDCVIATGFPYHDFDKLDEYLQIFSYLMKNTRGIRRFGSAAIDLCYVACGKFDAFFEYKLNPWDVAAGIIIIQEAGGKLSDFKGGETYYSGSEILASNPHIYEEFSEVIMKKALI